MLKHNTEPDPAQEFAAFLALDWADQEHAFRLQVVGQSKIETGTLEQKPAVLGPWVAKLRERFGGRPIAVGLEQSRGALIHALMAYDFLVLYPIHYHHVPVLAPQFHQRPSAGFARGSAHLDCKLGFGRHGYLSSCRASFNSSCVGATPWNLGLFSMNDTPFPLMVCATMHVGLPLVAAASASAPWMAAKLCPSISKTCHPNERHLSTTGATSMMSLTKPSSWIRL